MKPYVVLYNDDQNVQGGDTNDAIAAQDVVESGEAVRAALLPLGPVEMVGTLDGDPVSLSRRLAEIDPEVVFNLAEAARGVAELEACVAGVLELLGIAYTGNTLQALALCLDKPKTKALLRGSGIPVPGGVVLRDAERDSLEGLEFPAIVKPACMDASHGIEPDNVVFDERSARVKAKELLTRFPPAVIVERFIDGREISVSIAELGSGPEVLPLVEIEWQLPAGVPRVRGFEAKWLEGTEAFLQTPVTCPAKVSHELDRRIRQVALAAFEAVSCRDYARVDIRVDVDDSPVVLEVNPNPCVAPSASLARSARAAGWSYDDLIRRFVANAAARGPLAPLVRSRSCPAS